MNRSERLIGFLIFVGILIALAVGGFYWQQVRLSQELNEVVFDTELAPLPPAAAEFDGVTGVQGLGLGLSQEANLFAADAELVNASAMWVPVPDEFTLRTGVQSWTYTLYSPSLQEAVDVSVVNKQVTYGTPRPLSDPLETQPLVLWKFDSPQAMGKFLESGGFDFLATHRDVTLGMQVSMVTESGKPEVLIAAVDNTTGDTLTIWYDATFGDELRRLQVP